MAEKPQFTAGGCGTLVAALLLCGIVAKIGKCGHSEVIPASSSTPVAITPPAASAAPEREKPRCILGTKDDPTKDVLLFPSQDALSEFARADDAQGRMAAIRATGTKIVPAGTRCNFLDVGIAETKVRVIEGTFEGRAGWVPTEWTNGVQREH